MVCNKCSNFTLIIVKARGHAVSFNGNHFSKASENWHETSQRVKSSICYFHNIVTQDRMSFTFFFNAQLPSQKIPSRDTNQEEIYIFKRDKWHENYVQNKKSCKPTWKIAKMIPVMPTYNRLSSKKFSIDLKQPWNQKKITNVCSACYVSQKQPTLLSRYKCGPYGPNRLNH